MAGQVVVIDWLLGNDTVISVRCLSQIYKYTGQDRLSKLGTKIDVCVHHVTVHVRKWGAVRDRPQLTSIMISHRGERGVPLITLRIHS